MQKTSRFFRSRTQFAEKDDGFRSKKTLVGFTLLLGLGLIGGCTHQQLYKTAQDYQKQQCDKLPLNQRADCLSGLNDSFEQYQQKREEVLKNQDGKNTQKGTKQQP